MPRLAVVATRMAFLQLGFGATLGAIILTTKAMGIWPTSWAWLPAHIESLVIGWLVQLAFGVAFWILPRIGGQRPQAGFAWLAIVSLNLGVLLSGLSPLLLAAPWPVLAGRMLSVIGVAAFALHAWPRVKVAGLPG